MLTELAWPAVQIDTDPRLIEKAFGDWEGLDHPTIASTDPAGHAQRQREPFTFRAPGGESYLDVALRLKPLLEELHRPTLLVAHAGVIRSLLIVTGHLTAEVALSLPIVQGRWLQLERQGLAWHGPTED